MAGSLSRRAFSAACCGIVAGAGLRAAAAAARTADAGGIKVRYWSAGNGDKTLVFIHGWTCNHSFWRLNAPEFENTHRVLLVDLPGHGESEKPHTEYTQTLFARSVRAVMDHAGVNRAVLIGHSMGTLVARQFYREDNARVSGLVFVDGVLRSKPPSAEAREKFLTPMRPPHYKAFAARFITSMFSLATMPDLRKEILEQMLSTPEHVGISAMEQILSDPKVTLADPVTVPVLALYARSTVHEPDYESRLRTFIPRLEYEVLDGVGHFFMMEAPAVFNRRLRAFLNGNGL